MSQLIPHLGTFIWEHSFPKLFSAPAGSQHCSLNALWDVALSQREEPGRAQVLSPDSKSGCWEKQFTDGTEDKPQGHSGTWQSLYTWVILELAVLDSHQESLQGAFWALSWQAWRALGQVVW